MSLEALAGLVGTTNQQISNLESGRRRLTVEWLCRLGEALSCHPWTLVDDQPSGAASGSYPPDESLLLDAFRKLSTEQRRAVLTLLAIHKGESG